LNAVGSYSESLRTIVVGILSAHPESEHDYAPTICYTIEREYSVRRNLQMNGETALATQSARNKARTRPYCINCKAEGHAKQCCISEGGHMEGKTLKESREQRKRDRASERGGKSLSGTPKPKLVLYSSTGEAFLVDSSAAVQATTTTTTAKATSEFAGLASHSVEELARDIPGPPRARGEQRMDR
jgi:hypothetical protein